MRLSDCQSTVQACLSNIVEAMELQHWSITVNYVSLSGENAHCMCDASYQHATINIDPDMIDDEDKLYFVLRHELFHVVLADVGHLYYISREMLDHLGAPALAGFEAAREVTEERMIRSLERMFDDGMGIISRDLATGIWGKEES